MSNENMAEMNLPKNIRQIGAFGEKYKVYIEDFVYTYVHRFIHQRRREEPVISAVLLGRSVVREEQEYVFISGAQKVDFGEGGWGTAEENAGSMPDTAAAKQVEFWDRVYQRIKQSFDDLEILGWYFNLDGSSLEINSQLQQFFESTYKKGSRFLYFEDRSEQIDAFFVQEQHRLQRLTGYAVYYEKNPQMQQFMIEEKERLTPKPIREKDTAQTAQQEKADDVVQNYRAIMNKLNEKPSRRRWQPAVYVAGAAVLVIVAATAVTQVGNYQSLKTLQQTMQALSGAVSGGEDSDGTDLSSETEASGTEALSERTETGGDSSETGADSAAADGAAADSSSTADSGVTAEDSSDESSIGTETGASSGSTEVSAAQESSSGEDSGSSESAADADEVSQTGSALPSYYVVQKGDNLMAISQSLYNTTSKVDEICALNGIEDMDLIYEGQKLLLP